MYKVVLSIWRVVGQYYIKRREADKKGKDVLPLDTLKQSTLKLSKRGGTQAIDFNNTPQIQQASQRVDPPSNEPLATQADPERPVLVESVTPQRPPSQPYDDTEAVLQCSLCLIEYDSDNYMPSILPCGHSACKSCLMKHARMNRGLCPSCREPYTKELIRPNLGMRTQADLAKPLVEMLKKKEKEIQELKKAAEREGVPGVTQVLPVQLFVGKGKQNKDAPPNAARYPLTTVATKIKQQNHPTPKPKCSKRPRV